MTGTLVEKRTERGQNFRVSKTDESSMLQAAEAFLGAKNHRDKSSICDIIELEDDWVMADNYDLDHGIAPQENGIVCH